MHEDQVTSAPRAVRVSMRTALLELSNSSTLLSFNRFKIQWLTSGWSCEGIQQLERTKDGEISENQPKLAGIRHSLRAPLRGCPGPYFSRRYLCRASSESVDEQKERSNRFVALKSEGRKMNEESTHISPGISCSARTISLRPHAARELIESERGEIERKISLCASNVGVQRVVVIGT